MTISVGSSHALVKVRESRKSLTKKNILFPKLLFLVPNQPENGFMDNVLAQVTWKQLLRKLQS